MNKKIGDYTVKSDEKFRPLLSFYDLSKNEREKMIKENTSPLSPESIMIPILEEALYFRYKNEIYNLDDFTRINCYGDLTNICDAVMGFTYFNGIGIKLNKENDAVKVFYFFC